MSKELAEALRAVLKLKGKKRRRKSGIYRSLKDGDLINPIPLPDFLDGVGEILRLPPKTPEAEKLAEHSEAVSTAKRRSWRRILIPLAAAAMILFGLRGGPAEEALVPLPHGVLGIWSTNDPRYANRRFELTDGFVVFKHGDRPDDQSVHPISGVQTSQRGDSTLVLLKYLEAGTLYELAFKYTPSPRPGIRFSHQEELVWQRGVK